MAGACTPRRKSSPNPPSLNYAGLEPAIVVVGARGDTANSTSLAMPCGVAARTRLVRRQRTSAASAPSSAGSMRELDRHRLVAHFELLVAILASPVWMRAVPDVEVECSDHEEVSYLAARTGVGT